MHIVPVPDILSSSLPSYRQTRNDRYPLIPVRCTQITYGQICCTLIKPVIYVN
jgi:hypothetical protein